jgi:hypothetical protein
MATSFPPHKPYLTDLASDGPNGFFFLPSNNCFKNG